MQQRVAISHDFTALRIRGSGRGLRPGSDCRPSSTYILTSTTRHRHVSVLSIRDLESVGYLGRSHGAFYFIWWAYNTGIDAYRLAIDSGDIRWIFAVMYPRRRPDKKSRHQQDPVYGVVRSVNVPAFSNSMSRLSTVSASRANI